MPHEDLTTWFIQRCTHQKLIVVCLTLISLQFAIYGFSYTVVHHILDQNSVKHRSTVYDVIAIYHNNVQQFKLRARDYGDVITVNQSHQDLDLRHEIQGIKDELPYFRYLQPHNATVYDLMFVPPPSYLQSFKSPCFTERVLRLVNEHTLQHVYYLRCLPYFFVAGFTKSGTTDFHARLSQHALVTSGWTKEPHWWDNLHGKNSVLQKYMDLYQTATDDVAAYQLVDKYNRSYYPTVIGDFTPRLVWHGSDWRQDVLNTRFTEPRVLLPHRIRHIIPSAKVILLVRNPTHRLYSDYIDYMVRYNHDRQPPSPAHFHQLVTSAIGWWKDCIKTSSERLCSYDSPNRLAPLDSANGQYWVKHAADRLRIGLYVLYIQEWLGVFHEENIKILFFEDYKTDPLGTLSTEVLPFLKLDTFTPEEEAAITDLDVMNAKRVRLNGTLDQPMLAATAVALDQFYRPYNRRLFELLRLKPKPSYV